jgi:N6-adenosine-specific RNA methylase IME4
MSTSRHPQESFGFQRLSIDTTKPQEVAKADSCGCLEIGKQLTTNATHDCLPK